MNFLKPLFTTIATVLILLLLTISSLILKMFIGKSINNPKYHPIAGTIFGLLFNFNRLYEYQTELAKKWPTTFRFLTPDRSQIFTTDSKIIEHILKTSFNKYSKGDYNKELMGDLLGQGIFTADGDKWRQQRKLANSEFSTRVLRNFSSGIFRGNAAKMVRIISKLSKREQVFEIQDLFMRSTLDSMFKVLFGVDLNCLEGSSKEGVAFIKAFDDSNALTYQRYVDPFWKLKRSLNIGSEASLKRNIKVIDHFVYDLIKTERKRLAEQQDHSVEKEDILSRFLVESTKDPEGMTDKYLRDIILNFMIAGKDTSANALSWFVYMLCKNPLVQEKIVNEIKEVTGTEGDSTNIDDFVTSITEEVLEKMHYLHSALTETLRLYPSVPMDGQCAETDDILPDGYKVKKGDDVNYMAYAMGRMTHIWGEDTEEFRPERWLKNGIFQPESPFKFIAFHGGPRICLGKDFAYRQMKIVSMALLRFFRFKLADETTKVTYRTMFTLHIDGGLHLCAVPRISV